jgi:hypothetical protein
VRRPSRAGEECFGRLDEQPGGGADGNDPAGHGGSPGRRQGMRRLRRLACRAGYQGRRQWLIAVVAENGPYYVALPADKLVLAPRVRSSTRYTAGRETENSSANSAIVCFPPWWSWTKWACWRILGAQVQGHVDLGRYPGRAEKLAVLHPPLGKVAGSEPLQEPCVGQWAVAGGRVPGRQPARFLWRGGPAARIIQVVLVCRRILGMRRPRL